MSQWASISEEYTQQVVNMFQDLGEDIWVLDEQQQMDPVKTWERVEPPCKGGRGAGVRRAMASNSVAFTAFPRIPGPPK